MYTEISQEEIRSHLNIPVLKLISSVADEEKMPCYLIGGYVRDFFSAPSFKRY